MKFSIVIPTLFALLVGSVNAQGESDPSMTSVSSKPRSGTSSKPSSTPSPSLSVPLPLPSTPTTTGIMPSMIMPPASTVSIQSLSSSGGAVPTSLAGMQQIALGVALIGAAVL